MSSVKDVQRMTVYDGMSKASLTRAWFTDQALSQDSAAGQQKGETRYWTRSYRSSLVLKQVSRAVKSFNPKEGLFEPPPSGKHAWPRGDTFNWFRQICKTIKNTAEANAN
eukprot:3438049-Pyramimonas_sp.AAC.1